MTRNQIILSAAVMLCWARLPALAQVDLSGSWASKNHEDALERGAGPNPGDFTGIPFNESGRAKALSAVAIGDLDAGAHLCVLFAVAHDGGNVRREDLERDRFGDGQNGRMGGRRVGRSRGHEDLDGWPSAPIQECSAQPGRLHHRHLGRQCADCLHDAHVDRLPPPQWRMTSAQATMTTHFIRHGDMLTLASAMEDPIYLTEPYYITRTFVMTPNLMNSGGPPCIPGDEGVAEGRVPHYLPGKNPLLDELPKLYHIPTRSSAGRGGDGVSRIPRKDQGQVHDAAQVFAKLWSSSSGKLRKAKRFRAATVMERTIVPSCHFCWSYLAELNRDRSA